MKYHAEELSLVQSCSTSNFTATIRGTFDSEQSKKSICDFVEFVSECHRLGDLSGSVWIATRGLNVRVDFLKHEIVLKDQILAILEAGQEIASCSLNDVVYYSYNANFKRRDLPKRESSTST